MSENRFPRTIRQPKPLGRCMLEHMRYEASLYYDGEIEPSVPVLASTLKAMTDQLLELLGPDEEDTTLPAEERGREEPMPRRKKTQELRLGKPSRREERESAYDLAEKTIDDVFNHKSRAEREDLIKAVSDVLLRVAQAGSCVLPET